MRLQRLARSCSPSLPPCPVSVQYSDVSIKGGKARVAKQGSQKLIKVGAWKGIRGNQTSKTKDF